MRTDFLSLLLLALPSLTSATAAPTPGSIITHLFPSCSGHRVGSHKPKTIPVDKCFTLHSAAIQIQTPAVCANGTRAKWARFTDGKCNHGEITAQDELLDVEDSDVGKCLDAGTMGSGDEFIRSMSFWCDGFGQVEQKPDGEGEGTTPDEGSGEKSKQSKASVSHNACWGGGRPTAPVFRHPESDTCVDLQGGQKLKVYSTAVCANGTAALFAHFEGAGCQGKPELQEVEEEMLKTCLDMGDEASSYSFWCTGAITTVPEKDKSPAPRQPGKSSGLWGLLLILAFVFLFLVLAIVGVVQRFTRVGEGFLKLFNRIFKREDGAIQL